VSAPTAAATGFASCPWNALRSRSPELLLASGAPSNLVVGDAREVLAWLPEGSIQTCVTSPPYWHVRDYGIDGQLGLESDLDHYLGALVEVFAGVQRVLREDGTLWLNIGDGYTSGGRRSRAPDRKNPNRQMGTRPLTPPLLKPKELLGIPWRLVHALQLPTLACRDCASEAHATRWGTMPNGQRICPTCLTAGTNESASEGWYLRSEVIWNRPNCQPESVQDRPTRAHEHLFLLAKNPYYQYDNHAVRGPNDRNLRSVWSINTQPGRHGHIAPFPEALAERCLLLTSKPGDLVLDPFLGSATSAAVATRLDRRWLGIELNPDYAQRAEQRLLAASA
jgi:DNA modification methylase